MQQIPQTPLAGIHPAAAGAALCGRRSLSLPRRNAQPEHGCSRSTFEHPGTSRGGDHAWNKNGPMQQAHLPAQPRAQQFLGCNCSWTDNVQPIVAQMQQLNRANKPNNIQPMVVNAEKTDFPTRLASAMADANIAPRKRIGTLAKWCSVSRESARKWLAGESMPETKRIAAIARRLDITGEWLLTGLGPERLDAPNQAREAPGQYPSSRALPFIDVSILAAILDAMDDQPGEWPTDNREMADIIATGYARVVQQLNASSRESIRSILSQPMSTKTSREGERATGQEDCGGSDG